MGAGGPRFESWYPDRESLNDVSCLGFFLIFAPTKSIIMSVKVKDVCSVLGELAPLALQESYDNAGLLCGDAEMEVKSALLAIDVTEDVVDEAMDKGCNMIISHHPLIFRGLKKITGKSYVERCVIKAIKNDIAIYSSHTNLDKAVGGVSFKMAEKLGLKGVEVLCAEPEALCQIVTFVPQDYAEKVANAMFAAGGGCVGGYDGCSYRVEGVGTFRAGEGCNPFVGELGEMHYEKETRIEMVVREADAEKVRQAALSAHPYEEPVVDVYALVQKSKTSGLGVVGILEKPMSEIDALKLIKEKFKCADVRFSPLLGREVMKIALCGGSGAEFITLAMSKGADMYVTADCKYHEFFNAEGKILVADIGHFESEQFTKEIFKAYLSEKIPNFVTYYSEVNTNPINHL